MKGCECGAGKGIVGKEVGEGRDKGVALGESWSSGGRQESRGGRHPGFWEDSESSGEVGKGRACWWSGRGIGG